MMLIDAATAARPDVEGDTKEELDRAPVARDVGAGERVPAVGPRVVEHFPVTGSRSTGRQ